MNKIKFNNKVRNYDSLIYFYFGKHEFYKSMDFDRMCYIVKECLKNELSEDAKELIIIKYLPEWYKK
jgi:hypothetical protein